MSDPRRVFLVVLDGVGMGGAPDAAEYDSEGAHTLRNVSRRAGGLTIPRMIGLGLGQLVDFQSGDTPDPDVEGAYGGLVEYSAGMDTTTGHWELMGIRQNDPFPTFPEGFPEPLIKKLEQSIDRGVLGNRAASGTVIIEEWVTEHRRTGNPIVYTSADSVFQVAAHEEVIPVDELYEICRTARELLTGSWGVARVIARPFRGEPGDLVRTPRRRDFTLPPPEDTALDDLKTAGYPVIGVGKIHDIFAGRGLTESIKTKNNREGAETLLELVRDGPSRGVIMANLVDFDQKYGHRRDPEGFARALEEWDRALGSVLCSLARNDLLLITADHGNDPTWKGTDHTRERVPLLIAHPDLRGSFPLGQHGGFDAVGQTLLDYFGLPPRLQGSRLLPDLPI